MNRHWLRIILGGAALLACFLALGIPSSAPTGWAQEKATVNGPQQNTPPKDSTDQTQEKPTFVIPSTVRLVTTPVTVFDSGGQLVYDLEKDEFMIYDNGVQQDIRYFDSDIRKLSLVIVVETNDATEPFLDSVRPLGSIFSDAIMGPGGEVAVLTYSDHVDMPLDFTSNGDKLDTVLRGLHGRGGGMHMDDALLRALSMLDNPSKLGNRKVVIVFSDGYNIGSKMTHAEIVKGAMNSNITVYGLGFSPLKGLWKREPKDPAPDMINESVARSMPPGAAPTPTMAGNIYDPADVNVMSILLGLGEEAKKPLFKSSLQAFSRYSGGAYFQKWGKDTVQGALNEIGTEIHSQYELAYSPPKPIEVGFHTIKVEVRRPGAKVRARTGWFYQAEDVPRGVVVH